MRDDLRSVVPAGYADTNDQPSGDQRTLAIESDNDARGRQSLGALAVSLLLASTVIGGAYLVGRWSAPDYVTMTPLECAR